jgi:hypothetical protein
MIAALDPGLFGFMLMVASALVGYVIGRSFGIAKMGAILGLIGLPGWLITAAYGIGRRTRSHNEG